MCPTLAIVEKVKLKYLKKNKIARFRKSDIAKINFFLNWICLSERSIELVKFLLLYPPPY